MWWYLILKLQHSQVLVQQHVPIKVQAVPYSIAPSTKTDQQFSLEVRMIHPLTIAQKYWITLWTTVHGKNVCIAHIRYSFCIIQWRLQSKIIVLLDCLWALYYYFFFLRKCGMIFCTFTFVMTLRNEKADIFFFYV